MSARQQPIVTPAQLGVILQSARKSRGLTQAALAARLQLSQARVSELERGAGKLTVDQLLALCQQLGLQLSIELRSTDPRAAEPSVDW